MWWQWDRQNLTQLWTLFAGLLAAGVVSFARRIFDTERFAQQREMPLQRVDR